jgi:carboxyl-terminal processing protease
MKTIIRISAALACVLFPLYVSASQSPAPGKRQKVKPAYYYGKIARRIADTVPKMHVLQRPLDDEISRRAWTNLVTFYDFDHSVFLQSDLDRFSARLETIDDELRDGNVSFGYDLHNVYVERLRARIDFATNLLAKADWDFSVDESYRIRRKDAPWPVDTAEAEEHWRRRMKNEVLAQLLTRELDAEEEKKSVRKSVAKKGSEEGTEAEKKLTVEESLIKKYRQYYMVLTEPDEEAVLQQYLSAVSRAYDPHTDYMSPTSKEDFDMEMNLTLGGVGAVLSMDDGALKIVEVMPGGPMDRDGRVKEGDKIVGVRQDGGELEDIMWQPMKKTIKKIRGPKGTKVTLEIIPRSDPTGATKKMVDLVRDDIKLEDQAATGRVERVELGGVSRNLGYIYLPSFYGTMDKKVGDEGFRSAVVDIMKYIGEFNSQDVEGLVLDLRGNGGGSLREAVLLSALFVQSGPVVQISDIRMRSQTLDIPPFNPVAFRKPLVVLIDRASASASEIVAGHLKDCGRAVVIGDRISHGKGTVQTVVGLGPEKYGSIKVTTARFYRINGRSTQVAGVESDIHLPSLLDSLDIGEDKLTYALPFSEIEPADYKSSWNLDSYVPELQRRSEARLAKNDKYQKHLASVTGMKMISERESVPLERTARKSMMAADRELREVDEAMEDEEDAPRRKKRNERGQEGDVVLSESFKILMDLVRLNGGKEVPRQKGIWW